MPAHLALVHHANQFLITNGYQDRQGIDRIVEGYAAVLRLHQQHGVVVNLHLSGTLIEAAAWHSPWFLDMVKELRAKGIIELVGGVYAETVMTLFSTDFNVAQLNELLFLYCEHLECPPEDIRVCWVPERVWDTETLSPALTSEQLMNGGYEAVLLDDRLLYPTGDAHAASLRAAFDERGPFDHGSFDPRGQPEFPNAGHEADAHTIYEISGSGGLMVVPISANVRHWIPPTHLEHWSALEATVETFAGGDADDGVLVYADDLERTAGVGGWEESVIDAYDAFLRWMSERDDVVGVPLSSVLGSAGSREVRSVEPGTFFELAHVWGAGDDYRRWSDGAAWAPYRRYLEVVHADMKAAEEEGADKRLLELSRKHLFASTYETAWHDPAETGRAPAHWARAVASHARSSLVVTAAARWFARGGHGVDVRMTDIDGDGEDELVMANENLFAVIAPRHGGRLVYLFARGADGGALLIGNPSDDWNVQEDLNCYMVVPPNHPGALADVGFEHDEYCLSSLDPCRGSHRAQMNNVQRGSALLGARKTVSVTEAGSVLSVCYRLPEGATDLSVETCLSPDYYRLLREGQRGLVPYDGPLWRGFRVGDAAVWVALTPDERTAWAEPAHPRAGHGMNVRLRAQATHFHVAIGCGLADGEERRISGLLERAGQEED